jgi:SulP family sulfate permease
VSVLVMDLSSVPAIDATGLVSLESAIERLNSLGVYVILAGVQSQPLRVLARANWRNRKRRIAVFRSMERAFRLARERSRIGRTGTGRLPVPIT